MSRQNMPELWDLKGTDTSAFVDLFNLSQFYLHDFKVNFIKNTALHILNYLLLFRRLAGAGCKESTNWNEPPSPLSFFNESPPTPSIKWFKFSSNWEWLSVSPLAFLLPQCFLPFYLLFFHSSNNPTLISASPNYELYSDAQPQQGKS